MLEEIDERDLFREDVDLGKERRTTKEREEEDLLERREKMGNLLLILVQQRRRRKGISIRRRKKRWVRFDREGERNLDLKRSRISASSTTWKEDLLRRLRETCSAAAATRKRRWKELRCWRGLGS